MVARRGCVFERGGDVAVFGQGKVREDFFAARARCKQIKNVFDPDAQAAEAGAPANLLGSTVILLSSLIAQSSQASDKEASRPQDTRDKDRGGSRG